jgi:hypothetical protein
MHETQLLLVASDQIHDKTHLVMMKWNKRTRVNVLFPVSGAPEFRRFEAVGFIFSISEAIKSDHRCRF